MKYSQFILLLLLSILLPLEYVYSEERDTRGCNCKSLVVTSDDEAAGCTADVKMEVCAQYRQVQILRENENLREQAKRFHDDTNRIRIERDRGAGQPPEIIIVK